MRDAASFVFSGHYKIFCVNGNTGFRNESRVVPDEVLSKEFISQFKTEADVRMNL